MFICSRNKKEFMATTTLEIPTPIELTNILKDEPEASAFFQSLSAGYKRGYCDWVGGAKNEDTRKSRADKALLDKISATIILQSYLLSISEL